MEVLSCRIKEYAQDFEKIREKGSENEEKDRFLGKKGPFLGVFDRLGPRLGGSLSCKLRGYAQDKV